MGDTGLEHHGVSAFESKGLGISDFGGRAESGAVDPISLPNDPDLQQIIKAWPTLSGPIKKAILAMVEAVKG